MTRFLATTALIAAMSAPAAAQQAGVTTDLNMRAGPGTQYPVITTIPGGGNVRVHGCVSDYSWCDVRFSNNRGWVSSNYLEYRQDNRRRPVARWGSGIDLPVVEFVFGNYAERHYRDQPWYNDRDRWDRRDRRDDGRRGRRGDERGHRGGDRDDDRRGRWDDDRRGGPDFGDRRGGRDDDRRWDDDRRGPDAGDRRGGRDDDRRRWDDDRRGGPDAGDRRGGRDEQRADRRGGRDDDDTRERRGRESGERRERRRWERREED